MSEYDFGYSMSDRPMADNHLNIEAERAAFEAWYLKEAGESRAFCLGRNSSGEYAYAETEGMWMAWEERARRTPVADGAALDLPELPCSPQSLLNQIRDYGMARTDGKSEVERLFLWQVLIEGIKLYAAEFGREAISHYPRKQAGQVAK